MAYKRYKMLQKYVNGEAMEEYKQGELLSELIFQTLEECNDGNLKPDEDIEGEIYEWRRSSETMCNDVNKYYVDKEYVSYDEGQSWNETGRTRQGDLIEADSEDCTNVIYRWVVVTGAYICYGTDKYAKEKEQQSNDDGVSWFDTGSTRRGALIQADSEVCKNYESRYLTFEALENDTLITLSNYTYNVQTVYISTDEGETWIEKEARNLNTLATLNRGERMLIKGYNNAYAEWGNSGFKYSHFQITKPYNVSGNILSLVYGDDFIGQTQLPSTYTFAHLFASNLDYEGVTGTLVSAENLVLPVTSPNCYFELFYSEKRLSKAPELPATTLAYACYRNMFEYCESLTTAPALPATTLAELCYTGMFQYCTGLTTAPELPATTLVQRCYNAMFYGCTNLNNITCLATDITADYCTSYWLYNVSANGTFRKNTNVVWQSGESGIPNGWTVINV